MAYALVASVGATSGDTNAVTTGSIDTTGANLIVVGGHWFSASPMTLTDSKSNTWTALTQQGSGTGINVRLFYAFAPTVGSGHTFTYSGGLSVVYPSISVLAFSGSVTSPFDQENGAGGLTASSRATGSVTPSEDNEVFVAVASTNVEDVTSIDASFTLVNHAANGGTNVGYGSAYFIQSTAAAKNPTFTFAASDGANAVAIATFKAGADAGGQPMIRRFGLAKHIASPAPKGHSGVSIMRLREAA